MPIKSGNKGIIGSYFGSTPIIKIYKGSNLVFQQKKDEYDSSLVIQLLDRSISTTAKNLTNEISNIGSYSFYDCTNLESITLPSSITTINVSSLYNVKYLTLLSETPPTLASSTLNSILKIYVPSSSVETYKAADVWSTYASKIEGV
jgi:hypothetical protein